jgi:hypothetical protein
MTSHAWTLSLDQFALSSRAVASGCPLRIALLPGELLRVPRERRTLRVLGGRAWVSHHGEDYALRTGETLCLEPDPHGALVSAEGRPLFLEIV